MNVLSKLIYKDLIGMKSFKNLIFVFAIFIVGLPFLESSAIMLVPFYLSFVLSFQIIGYEEKYNGRYLTGYLPVKREHTVMAKYMEGCILTFIGASIVITMYLVLNSIGKWDSEFTLLILVFGSAIFSLVGNAIFLPLYMIIGMNKARIVLTFLVVGFIVVPLNFISSIDVVKVIDFITLNKELLMFGGLIITWLIYGLSYLICSSVLNNKDI